MKFIPAVCIILLAGFFSCMNSSKDQDTNIRGLLLTGNDHPAHKWKETTPAIKAIFEEDSSVLITVTENPESLAGISRDEYDFLVLNYCNWEDSTGLSADARVGFLRFLEDGGGLIVLHFSNGAFHYSLPGAKTSDWPEYRKIVKRVWDHNYPSAHDNYGSFLVEIGKTPHFITRNLNDFGTLDELYFNQRGDTTLLPLISALSVKTGRKEPLAWAYNYGNARVFQSLLGHGPESYAAPAYRKMLRRSVNGCAIRMRCKNKDVTVFLNSDFGVVILELFALHLDKPATRNLQSPLRPPPGARKTRNAENEPAFFVLFRIKMPNFSSGKPVKITRTG